MTPVVEEDQITNGITSSGQWALRQRKHKMAYDHTEYKPVVEPARVGGGYAVGVSTNEGRMRSLLPSLELKDLIALESALTAFLDYGRESH